MDDTRPPEQRDALARRALHEWIAANARQQSLLHQIIDWLDERAHDAGDETAYEAAQRLLDVLRALVDDQQRATAARDTLAALEGQDEAS
jgi:hypothetical protein